MGNVFSLDSLREEADKAYAPLKVALSDGSEVVLRNLLRLKKDVRTEVFDLLKKLEETEEQSGQDHVDNLLGIVEELIRKVADRGDDLLNELDGDIALSMQILNGWLGESQAGEAESSPNS